MSECMFCHSDEGYVHQVPNHIPASVSYCDNCHDVCHDYFWPIDPAGEWSRRIDKMFNKIKEETEAAGRDEPFQRTVIVTDESFRFVFFPPEVKDGEIPVRGIPALED